MQDEAQSYHWDNGMVTLHPFVYYYKDEGQICHGNFVLISDCNKHDTVAVHLFQRRLINHLHEKFQYVSNIVYFSDGCAGQYKKLKNVLNLYLHEENFDIPAEWHFLATSHGKGPSDGTGGTIKHEATKASLQRPYKDQILAALDLFHFVESSLNGINVEFLTYADWQTEEDLLRERFSIAKTIAGTRRLHDFKPLSKSILRAWEFSASSSAREVSVVTDNVREVEVELRAIAGYIAVEYDGKWWIAYVNEIFSQSNKVSVNFLHPHGPSPSYFYPRRPDSLAVDVGDILVQLSPSTVTGWTYHLSEDDTERVTVALQLRNT